MISRSFSYRRIFILTASHNFSPWLTSTNRNHEQPGTMRSLLVVAGIAGCSSLAATDARHRFLSETLEEPEDVMLKTADLHANLLREPPMTIKLDNRYKFTGLGELVSQLIDHHTTLGSVGSSGTMARQKLLNYHNSQYFGEIKIGTPGRRFVVVSDEIMLPHASKMESHLNPTSGL